MVHLMQCSTLRCIMYMDAMEMEKKMFLALRKEGIGRRKRELTFPKRLRRFERRLYCLAVGGEHDEVDDAASVGSVEHQRMKHP